ncbi:MAG: hypothetical protein R2940_10005 [Syntrophotaleaceae bacterium]
METDLVATDGQWLAWKAKDRQGISLYDGIQARNVTQSLPPEHYPQDMVFDGRYVAFVSQGKHLFVVDSESAAEPVLVASSVSRIEYFAISSGELVWIDRADNHVYHLTLGSADPSPERITTEEKSRIMVKIDAGVIVWSESDLDWRVAYYDLRAASPAVVQPAGQTHLAHWQANIHDRLIVWQGSDAGNDVEIFYCDLTQDGTPAMKLTSNATDDRHPRVHDRYIAWDGFSGGQETIFYVDMENPGNIQALPTPAQYDRLSHVREGLIAWTASVDDRGQVFYYDLDATEPAIIQVTDSAYHNYEPLISGGKIFWRTEEAARSRIMTHDPATATTVQLADLPYSQITMISAGNGYPVWLSMGAHYRIFVQSAGEEIAPFAITPLGLDVATLEMDDGVVVWRGYDGTSNEIYCCDLNAVEREVTKLTDDSLWKEVPQVSDRVVVWRGQGDGGDYQIYYVDLKSENPAPAAIAVAGQENLSPRVHDGLITWLGGIWPNYEVYYYDLNAASPQPVNLTNNSLWESGPMVNGGIITWYRQNTGNINDVWYVDLNAASPGEVQVTNSSDSDDRVGVVSDRIIAWTGTVQAESSWHHDIFYLDLTASAPEVVRVTEDGASKGDLTMDGGRLAWRAEGEIYLFDVHADDPQVIRLTDNDVSDFFPKTRGDIIIWRSGNATCVARWQ